jgi:hypothetical protein
VAVEYTQDIPILEINLEESGESIPTTSTAKNAYTTEFPNNAYDSKIPKNFYSTEHSVYKSDSNVETGNDEDPDISESDDLQIPESGENHSLSEWDKKFLAIRQIENQTEENFSDLSKLVDQFIHAAATYCKMIVAEQHCSDEEKILKSINVGGIAGGSKYRVHGLFYKYPVDTLIDRINVEWLYGGKKRNDNNAAKD